MKMKLFLLVLLFSTFVLKAQTTPAKLDQVGLFKQFLGCWTGEVGKDTIITGTNSPFGSGMVCVSQIVTKGTILDSVRQILGYDPKNDKFIMAELIKSYSAFEICASWFTSEHSGEIVLFQDISNPENAALKWIFELKSPDLIEQSAFLNNRVVKTVTLRRVGK